LSLSICSESDVGARAAFNSHSVAKERFSCLTTAFKHIKNICYLIFKLSSIAVLRGNNARLGLIRILTICNKE